MPETYDFAVIGAGIAGASAASELVRASAGRVALLEMETHPGYHTTGRSAAVYAPSYGPPAIRALTRASEGFFNEPPNGFSETGLISPRAIMMIARAEQMAALDALVTELSDTSSVSVLSANDVLAQNPLLRQNYAEAAMLDGAGRDIDVAGLHQGYLRSFKSSGGEVLLRCDVQGIEREGDFWSLMTSRGILKTRCVVNAAGAWADQIGALAGAEAVGLQPKRRTAAIVRAPDGMNADPFPITIDIEEQFYLKPDAGRLLISPADETPVEPCDVQPEDLDVAICVDRIETAFELSVRRIESKWAGLRSFVADKAPVVGYSGKVENFYWLAGQGGYGIQSSPALSRLTAAEILGRDLPSDILDQGLNPEEISPQRMIKSA